MNRFTHWLGAALLSFTSAIAHAQQTAPAPEPVPPPDLQAIADGIAQEVADIRGLPFRRPVTVQVQSREDFSRYVDRRIAETVPERLQRHYGTVVRALGLYRGPLIDDFRGLMNSVMTSQVGAYFDPEKQTFFVLVGEVSELMRGVLYSHELYHALQDQHFDLNTYLQMNAPRDGRAMGADERLARQAVVEGEATYLMTLWMMRRMTGGIPPRPVLAQAVNTQANMSLEQMAEATRQAQAAGAVDGDMVRRVEEARELPAFLLDTLMGAYLKGLGFVFAVHEGGWAAVERLYREYPPQSTEHILHPDKWLAREPAVRFQWPDFARARALRDWELLDDNVLGEFQWRIVFREHGLSAAEAEAVAAGWGGDRYAVFKRRDSDATLLLLRTSWDSEAEAREFAEAYRRLLTVKHEGAPMVTRVEQQGTEVHVVEGGDEASARALLDVVRGARRVGG